MDPIFRNHFNNKKRFDYEFNNDWKDLGHQLLSSNIIKLISNKNNNQMKIFLKNLKFLFIKIIKSNLYWSFKISSKTKSS